MINNLYSFFSSIYPLFNCLWRSLAFSVFLLRKLFVPVKYLTKTAEKIKSKSTNKRETDIQISKTCWKNKIHYNIYFNGKPEADQVMSKQKLDHHCQQDIDDNELKTNIVYTVIKPHYRSEGRRQGSSGVFRGLYNTICAVYVCLVT